MSSVVTATEITGRTASKQEPGVAATRRGRDAERMREKYQRLKREGLCTQCGKPRGEGGTETVCLLCKNKAKSGDHERYQRRKEAGLCVACGEPRGEGGTETVCQRCADKDRADRRERRRRRKEVGLCVACGEPRGEGGTGSLCTSCVEKQAARGIARWQTAIEGNVCTTHGAALHMLKLCPVCRYQKPGGHVHGLTFKGLLPPPSSGDKLDSCVGCERCGRRYHRGSSYSAPRRTRNAEINEHIGKEGRRVWLRVPAGEEVGEAEYEECSTPELKCIKPISRAAARTLLSSYRKGKRVPGMCNRHARSTSAITEIVKARLHHQFTAPARPQNGIVSAEQIAPSLSDFKRRVEEIKPRIKEAQELARRSLAKNMYEEVHKAFHDLFPEVIRMLPNSKLSECAREQVARRDHRCAYRTLMHRQQEQGKSLAG